MRRKAARLAGAALTAVALTAAAVRAAPPCEALAALRARLDSPGAEALDASPTRAQQTVLLRRLMAEPLRAPCEAAQLLAHARAQADAPAELLRAAAALADADATTAPDPPADAPAALPGVDTSALPEPLRGEVDRMLAAIAAARARLDRVRAALPPSLTPAKLRAQLLGEPAVQPTDDLRLLLPQLDRARLATGMVELAQAAARLYRFAAGATLPPLDWRQDTPLGAIVVDTRGNDDAHEFDVPPMLLLDTGGNDHYRFHAAPPAGHVAVLIDLAGDDRYHAADGADPSAATLGYGILWDGAGDDTYDGGHFAQAAALFGAALLVDGGGANRFAATGHAQGWALGGIAVLAAGGGDDTYFALTHAQASAGPLGVALLVERGGDDRYLLGNTPLLRPSPQLSTRNTSMGQGAGRGLRAGDDGRPPATGGIGALLDLAGDDRYEAQVFAQGAGFAEGVGLLADGGGNDRYEAAWYAQGASAHLAVGVLLDEGEGADRYRASHATSLGAAHDRSAAAFVDAGGDDDYALGDLGLGAAHDESAALFADLGGADRYDVGPGCRAFGVVAGSNGEKPRGGAALFIDRDRDGDRRPAHCPPEGNRR